MSRVIQDEGQELDFLAPLETVDQSIEKAKQMVEAAPQGDPSRERALLGLVVMCRCRYLQTKNIEDLTKVIENAEELLRATSETNDGFKGLWLEKLGNWYDDRYDLSQEIGDLDRAIEFYQQLASSMPVTDPSRVSHLARVSMSLHKRFELSRSSEDLDRVIEAASTTLESMPLEHSGRPSLRILLVNLLQQRSTMTGTSDDANRAIEMLNSGVQTMTPGELSDLPAMRIFIQSLIMAFEQTGSVDYLNQGVTLLEEALQHTPANEMKYFQHCRQLGMLLMRRFENTGSIDDVLRGIDVTETSVDNTPAHDNGRISALNTLGALRGLLFQHTGEKTHLELAIESIQAAIDALPADSFSRFGLLHNLSTWYGKRYDLTGEVCDINLAIDTMEPVLQEMAPGTDRAASFNNMGDMLSKRFQRLGDMNDLNRAIGLNRQAIEETPADHPKRSSFLNNLGIWLGLRFQRTGQMTDINEAVDVAEAAVRAILPDHSERHYCLGNLGRQLSLRYEDTGSLPDLNRSIQVTSLAVEALPLQHPVRARWLNNLGSELDMRFQRLGTTEDLDRAIEYAKAAVKAIPPGHPDLATCLRNLGMWLGSRFEKTGDPSDIDQAIDFASLAVDSTPREDVSYALRAQSLASLLNGRYHLSGELEDINRAIDVLQSVLGGRRRDSRERLIYLKGMAGILASRFDRTGDMDSINKAIEAAQEVTEITHPENFQRAVYFLNLAASLATRWEHTKSAEDKQRILETLMAGWNCTNGLPSTRIRLGRGAAGVYASRFDWKNANAIMQEVVSIIPNVSPRILAHRDKQSVLEDFSGAASMAAACALSAGESAEKALQLLELGRGLAQKFEYLRDQLDAPESQGKETDVTPESINRRHKVSEMLDETINEIRQLSGFEDFLLPPTAQQMMDAADRGPLVVVNVHRYRCDAFIVECNRISSLRLPDLDMDTILEMERKLRIDIISVLEWLWATVTLPVLDYLGFRKLPSDEAWPHIWWVPIGPLAWFPVHAAGRHFNAARETVLDHVMSSYSSSVKSIIYGRRHRVFTSTSDYALLVAMPQTSGQSPLPSASKEIQMLRDLCPGLNLQVVDPAYPTRENVLEQLRHCKIFHFAGHGLSDPAEPSDSCLVVHDWQHRRLTVGDLRDLRLHETAPFLSYLSACSTSSISRVKLIDEGIHLVNACQLAGFRHVVGTLWEVSDSHCVEAAEILYSTLKEKGMNDEAVCLGLHRAVRYLRDRDGLTSAARSQDRVENEFSEDEVEQRPEETMQIDERQCMPADAPHSTPDGRNAVPKKGRKSRAQWHWVPYVHFGV
ncbi:hypothetical protein ASPBRDRAFT_130524 [Aspergillus brasiliensis CBS 101740]|uniref:CHAT domain-containing protein n=1 Tax=Aspergillus brasiliensis (strain CBS 101740 / IMI 381727 / IBT 21946) TaxID=767769 RepID=A0A1L9UCY6_ASPBC|nr:hypothetical protein ASPBRDRAFT_130524 [Aspergillus brasiliensis CBS 101740]